MQTDVPQQIRLQLLNLQFLLQLQVLLLCFVSLVTQVLQLLFRWVEILLIHMHGHLRVGDHAFRREILRDREELVAELDE